MEPASDYRVLSKAKAAMIIAVVVILGGFMILLGESVIETITVTEGMAPEEALSWLATLLKVVAVSGAILMWAFSGFIVWYARKAVQTRSMPPVGAWIVEGQRIRVGTATVWSGRILIALAALLAVLGLLQMICIWAIANDILSGI